MSVEPVGTLTLSLSKCRKTSFVDRVSQSAPLAVDVLTSSNITASSTAVNVQIFLEGVFKELNFLCVTCAAGVDTWKALAFGSVDFLDAQPHFAANEGMVSVAIGL